MSVGREDKRLGGGMAHIHSLQGAVSNCISLHIWRNDPNCHFQGCGFSVVACLVNTVLLLFMKEKHAVKRPHVGLDGHLGPFM